MLWRSPMTRLAALLTLTLTLGLTACPAEMRGRLSGGDAGTPPDAGRTEPGRDATARGDDGAEPASDAGAEPAADAGTGPAADAGMGPAADAGTGPAADAGAAPDAEPTNRRDAGAAGTPDAIDFTPGQVPASAPAWVAPLVPGTWTAISQNTIRDVDPARDPALNPNYPNEAPWRGGTGIEGLITAWGGGAMAYGFGPKGSFLVWGGGHGDYHGNEIYSFDLETQRWSRLNDPYPTPSFSSIEAYPEGHYPDGTPVPPHTTDRLVYHPGTNSFITLEVEKNNFGGYLLPIPYMFSLDQRQWRHGPESPQYLAYMGWSALDTRRDLIWVEGGGASGTPLSSFDPKGQNPDGTFGAWVNYQPQLPSLGAMGGYDPIDDVLVVTSFRSGTDIYGIDPASPTTPALTLQQSGDVPASRPQAHGWEWSAQRGAFLFWAGGDVYELKATGAWRTAPWRWTRLTNPANTTTPDYASNGVFSRFRVINYGGLDIAVTVNSTSGQVYAFRVP